MADKEQVVGLKDAEGKVQRIISGTESEVKKILQDAEVESEKAVPLQRI